MIYKSPDQIGRLAQELSDLISNTVATFCATRRIGMLKPEQLHQLTTSPESFAEEMLRFGCDIWPVTSYEADEQDQAIVNLSAVRAAGTDQTKGPITVARTLVLAGTVAAGLAASSLAGGAENELAYADNQGETQLMEWSSSARNVPSPALAVD